MDFVYSNCKKYNFDIVRSGFYDYLSFKLKVLWDELNIYYPIPLCNYESNKTLNAYEGKDRTMQFLMGQMKCTWVYVVK